MLHDTGSGPFAKMREDSVTAPKIP
jgi:hypothetical protein